MRRHMLVGLLPNPIQNYALILDMERGLSLARSYELTEQLTHFSMTAAR